MLSQMYQGLLLVLNFSTLGMVTLGVLVGTIFGALPGLTTAMAMGLFVPVTFFMGPLIGIPFLMGLYKGGIYGGSIPAILISTPGTGAAAATVADGYELTKQGKSGKALQMAKYASVIGDSISSIATLFTIGILSEFSKKIGVVEVFAVLVFTFVIITTVSGKSILKGLISGCLGLLVSLVGMDIFTGSPRFTFGSVYLIGGISFVPLLIGMFALSEIFLLIKKQFINAQKFIFDKSKIKKGFDKLTKSELFNCLPTIIRSSIIGIFIGIIPGIGQPISAFLCYGIAKNRSKNPEKFGKGALEGIAAAESGNNAVDGSTFIPLLTLGIPGDVITAIMLGAFVVQGLRPGPSLMSDYGVEMYGILITMVLANFILFGIASFLIPIFAKLVLMPKEILIPIILSLAVVGAYAINNSTFDLFIAFIFGIVGYVMKLYEFPLSPFVILFLLGDKIERSLGQTLVKGDGSLAILFQQPISAVILIFTILFLLFSVYNNFFKKRKTLLLNNHKNINNF